MDWLEYVRRAAKGSVISSGRSSKFGKITFDNLIFVPAQLAKFPVDYFKEKINSDIEIGKLSAKPLRLKTPILIAAMSFGALSREAKLALAEASSLAGTSANTGEGGMLPEERRLAKKLIAQYSTGRFGVDEAYLKSADAIEIKIGQGAKPGQGGLLPAEKVTEEIAKIRRVKLGEDIHSPAKHPDIKDVNDLKEKIKWLKKVTEGVPVIIKFGAGDVEQDVKLAVKAGADVIAIDGMEGGTGAAPRIMLNDFGIPTLPALVKARRTLDRMGAKQELLIGGGISTGSDVAKALALGADAVFMGTALLVAMGCIYCRKCYTGMCPVGIATQDPKLRKKFAKDAPERVANFIKTCTEEVKMAAGACGYDDITKLNRKDLRALDELTAKITGVELV